MKCTVGSVKIQFGQTSFSPVHCTTNCVVVLNFSFRSQEVLPDPEVGPQVGPGVRPEVTPDDSDLGLVPFPRGHMVLGNKCKGCLRCDWEIYRYIKIFS